MHRIDISEHRFNLYSYIDILLIYISIMALNVGIFKVVSQCSLSLLDF